jgi:phosphoglycerate dehydrogenase-like enzyme
LRLNTHLANLSYFTYLPHVKEKTLKVLIAHTEPQDFQQILLDRFPNDDLFFTDRPEELVEDLARHQPEVVFSIKQKSFPSHYHPSIVSCPSVRWVQVGGSGYEHLGPWDSEKVQVTNCAGVLARHLAETVTGAMISLNNNTFIYRDQQRAKQWQTHQFRPLTGQTILIVGLGSIGEWVAHNAKALGMHVIGLKRSSFSHPAVDEAITPDQLQATIGRADIVSLHVRQTEETYHLLNKNMLGSMKKGSMLINTSRGAVIDQQALIEALNIGHIGSAYLDVFDPEPLEAESPLWEMDNVLVTPHVSDHVKGWPLTFANFFADNLNRYKANQPLINLVAE